MSQFLHKCKLGREDSLQDMRMVKELRVVSIVFHFLVSTNKSSKYHTMDGHSVEPIQAGVDVRL